MAIIGILGGMGPLATVDFINKLIALTPAKQDQEHLPYFLANLPQIPDRSAAILGQGNDPLPMLRYGIDKLNHVGVSVVAIPCNSSHHWHEEMSRQCFAPILHIAKASTLAIKNSGGQCVAILATRGALKSGFYQRELERANIDWILPETMNAQIDIDQCIHAVKAGNLALSANMLMQALEKIGKQNIDSILMACTEIPIAAQHISTHGLILVDSSMELARATVGYALSNNFLHHQ
jgi:aspartate racemase